MFEVILVLVQFDAFVHCFDVQNIRFRAGDFDLARILWTKYGFMMTNHFIAGVVCYKVRTPLMSGTMISIGGLALLLIGGSEIKPAPVIPYMTMFNGCLVVPPMWILYSRFARYKHVNSIL